jgi:hypothetical protein
MRIHVPLRLLLVGFVLVQLVGCHAPVPPPPEAAAGCNPIVGDDCLTPYPSSFFETSDSLTATGVRVQLPEMGALPVQASGVPVKPDRINEKDGFSPATPFVVYLKGGVDPTPLFGWKDPSPSLAADSPVQVIEYDTGARVLAFAELDANATAGQRQGLIIHPLVRLNPATRYVIALLGLKSPSGQSLAPAPFRALRDGTTLSKSLTPLKARYDEIFGVLKSAGVQRSALTVAWDVVTASDLTATGHLLGMRDVALGMADQGQLSYAITSSTDTPDDPNLLREILATVQVPWYLADQTGRSMMNRDANGNPIAGPPVSIPFVIHIPQCATTATGPLPLVVFGHGLFGTALGTLRVPQLEAAGNQFCGVFIGTDWIGLSQNDLTNIAAELTTDLNNFTLITDRLQQAHVNAQVMTRMVRTIIKNDPAMQINGKPVIDGTTTYYFGISLGGIQGTTFMTLVPDIDRGVLNVPGSEWSVLIDRSCDFAPLKPLLTMDMPDPLDQLLSITWTQSEWDYTDPATFAPHLIHDPLPGSIAKHILVQESIGDAQVANVATRVLARTMGLSGFDLSEPVPGLTLGTPPLDSAYTQWNSHPNPAAPLTDTALTMDNGAHDSVWMSMLGQQQMLHFLTPQGQAISVCDGQCNISN